VGGGIDRFMREACKGRSDIWVVDPYLDVSVAH
jgi:hypothetical protein